VKNDRINYVLVGGFVLAMVIALLVAAAVLSGRTGPTDTYYTRFSDATGLKFGSQVLYMGYPVGQVEQVRPVIDGDAVGFELELSVAKEFAAWKVPADSVAEARASGLLAAVTVDIRAGSSAVPLRPGDHIEARERRDLFGAMSDTADTVRELTVTSIKPLLENLNRYVSGVGGVLEQRSGPLLENLSKLSGELAGRAPLVIDDFLATTQDLRAVSARLELLLSEENAGKLGDVVDNVLIASEDLSRLASTARAELKLLAANVASLTRGLEDSRGTLDALLRSLHGASVDNRADVRAAVRDLRHSLATVSQHIDAVSQSLELSARNMAEFSRRLKADPGLLLRGAPPVNEAGALRRGQ
jgi:phospholipid/cholesterol/gamma-HCH transport system substrate-binding protein